MSLQLRSRTLALSMVLAVNVGWLQAADVLVESGIPTIEFDDDDNGAGVEWELRTIDEGERMDFRSFNGAAATTTPVTIEDNVPTATLYLRSLGASNGAVGIGTSSPTFPLHVIAPAAINRIAQFSQNKPGGAVVVGFQNTAAASVNNSCGFDFNCQTSAGQVNIARVISALTDVNNVSAQSELRFRVFDSGNLVDALKINGTRVSIGTPTSSHFLRVLNATCNGATWQDACSRELKQDIAPLNAAAAREALAELAPVTYAYKHEANDPRVGFVAEDVPSLVAMADGKSLSPMDIVAVLTKVTQEQERELETLRAKAAEQEARLAAQERAIAAIMDRLN